MYYNYGSLYYPYYYSNNYYYPYQYYNNSYGYTYPYLYYNNSLYNPYYYSNIYATTAPQGSAVVTIQSGQFVPYSVTLIAGGTIQWYNADSFAHSVVPNTGPLLAWTGVLLPGQTSQPLTLSIPGVYYYSDANNPTMVGQVVVQ